MIHRAKIFLFGICITVLCPSSSAQDTAQIARRPTVKEDPQPFPEAALVAGNNGTVLVDGLLGADGVFRSATLGKLPAAENFDVAWDKTIAYCRSHPKQEFRKAVDHTS